MALVGFVGLGLLVGAADGTITAAGTHAWYLSLTRPPGTPPAALFGPVWTMLYLLIGTAAWLVWRQAPSRARPAGGRRCGCGAGNCCSTPLWTPAFFGLRSPGIALLAMLPLAGLIGLTIAAFGRIHRLAAMLLLPLRGLDVLRDLPQCRIFLAEPRLSRWSLPP